MTDLGVNITGSYDPEPPFQFTRPEWQAQASCHPDVLDPEVWKPWGDSPTDLFFPTGGTSPSRRRVIESICGTCPVQEECLDHGLRFEKEGFWGGKGSEAMKPIRRVRGISRRAPEIDREANATMGTFIPPAHGSEARYQRHIRDNDKPCPACVDAHQVENHDRSAERYADFKANATPEQRERRRQQRAAGYIRSQRRRHAQAGDDYEPDALAGHGFSPTAAARLHRGA